MGLDCLGVLETMKKYPVVLREAFVSNTKPLTLDMILELYVVVWSLKGTARREQETRIVSYWRDFVEEIEGLLFVYII